METPGGGATPAGRIRLSGALAVKTFQASLPHVVIIGAGFGGMETARRLRSAPVRITLIDRLNYHTFQPLLYQVAIAGLIPSQIAYPVRTIFRHQKNVTFQMGEVTAIDFDARYVKLDGSVIAYDYLVLAVGGQTNFFGLGSVEQNAHQALKLAHRGYVMENGVVTLEDRADRLLSNDAVRQAYLGG